MKKYSKYIIGGLCVLSVAFSASSFMKVNAASASAAVPAQPVDLTFAAEKALPAVVHIRFVQNSKVQTVEVQSDPISSATHSVSLAILDKATVENKSDKYKHPSVKQQARASSYRQTDISLPITTW